MNLNSFLTCLSLNNIATGNAIAGIFNFNSGDSNLIYNNIYSTGLMYFSGIVSTLYTPLVTVGQPLINSSFSGVNNFRIGYSSSGDFGLLLDIQYDSCSKLNNIDYCLLSSNTINNSGKNFSLYINDANRLSLKTSGGFYSTLSQELTEHDFIYFSISQHQYINFGIFNVAQNQFFNKQIDLGSPNLNTDIVYIGSEFNNPTSTGFFGTINNAILFNQPLYNFNSCVGCYFTTGFNLSSNTSTVYVPQITGIYYSGISTVISSSVLNSGLILKENGSSINVEYSISSSSGIISGLIATPLYGSTGINISQPSYTFYQDTGIVNTYNKYEILFDVNLQSGDALEVYTYYYPIPNIGTQLISFDVSNINGIMQLMANGIAENLNIDYSIVRNQVSGFFPNDVLSFDILNSQSVTINFSGTFNNIFTGANTGINPILNVTGLSGICFNNINYPKFGYDVYLNGQKLISGYEYNIQNSGVSGFNVLISGSEILNPTMTAIDSAELTFLPQFNNFIYFVSGVTQNTNILSGIVGFSEQIWVNGVRQDRNIDYWLSYPCSTQSGISNIPILPYKFYNNEDNWNFNYPIKPSNVTGVNFVPNGTITGFLDFNLYWPNVNVGVYNTGNYLQILSSINSGLSGINFVSTNSNTFKFTNSGTGHGQTICTQLTYRNGNVISEPSPINCFNY